MSPYVVECFVCPGEHVPVMSPRPQIKLCGGDRCHTDREDHR